MNGSSNKHARGQTLGKNQGNRVAPQPSGSGRTQTARNQNSNRPVGNNIQIPEIAHNVASQRQAMPAGRHNNLQEDHNSSPFINAPISLTNLVQLSGISLTPVSGASNQQQQNRRQQQSISNGPNNRQIITFDTLQRPKITVSINSRQQHQQSPQQQIRRNNQTSDPISHQQRRTYNLEAIPSLQLLNQHDLVASSSSANSARDKHSELRTQPKAQATSSTSKKPRSQAKPIGVYLPSSSSNQVQILPMPGNSGLSMNSNNARDLQSYDISNLASRMSRSESPSSANQDSGTGDGDSMSLMKLMAILNNPALTITAVDAGNPAVQNMQRYNNDQGNAAQSLPRATNNRKLASADDLNKINRKHKNKVPKSAANLQLLNGNAMSVISDDAPFQTLGDTINGAVESSTSQTPRLASVHQKQYEGLNWLSELSVPIIENDPGAATLSWSKIQPIEENLRSDDNDFNIKSPCAMNVDIKQPIEYNSNNQFGTDRSIFETECIVDVPKIKLGHLNQIARYQHTSHKVYTTNPRARCKGQPMQSTERRLYLPRAENTKTSDSCDEITLSGVDIEEEYTEKILSERHQVLEKLNEIAQSVVSRRALVSDPDDIFVNKSKRVMSKIDSDIERMKKRRFDMITRVMSPSIPARELDSDDESFDGAEDVDKISSDFVAATVIPIQLPLDEEITSEKRRHFSAIGLVSRDDRNKIELKQHEKRFRKLSTIATPETGEVPDDIKRFVDAVIKTGGKDIDMRTDTDIKRNELPFIEGLNRNSSRTKLNFMSSLGLDKRSKRTTLYKVRPQEVINNQTTIKPQNDLSIKSKPPGDSFVKIPSQTVVPMLTMSEPMKQLTNGHLNGTAELWKAIKFAQASCREALKVPDKAEYMKSLGLLAS